MRPLYGSPHDDELMVNLAHNILNGDWLGEFTDKTLVKPPGYPIFLVFSQLTGFRPTVLLQAVIVVACWFIFHELKRKGVGNVAVEIGFVTAVFLPVWFGEDASRLYRDYFLAAMMFVVIGFTLWIAKLIESLNPDLNVNKRKTLGLVFAVCCLGLVISWIRITKNVSFAAYFFALTVIGICLISKYAKFLKQKRYVLLLFIGFVLTSQSLNWVVAWQNKQTYGVAITNNYTEGQFARANKVMASVEVPEKRQYVVISKSMRSEMYAVSPTLSRLEQYLESPENTGWRTQPCQSVLKICDESAAWFPWDLRDAAASAGLARTAVEFENTFRKIAVEIEKGCSEKLILCGNTGAATGIGPLLNSSPRHVFESTIAGINNLFNFRGAGSSSAVYSSNVSKEQLDLWNEVVNGLPKNSPLNSVYPGINAGANTSMFLNELMRLIWQICWILAGIGYLSAVSKLDGSRNLSLGIIGMCGGGGLVMQLSIAESQIGLFNGSLYYLPIYPFLIIGLVVGLDNFTLLCRRNLVALFDH